jgi:hypothetical protein
MASCQREQRRKKHERHSRVETQTHGGMEGRTSMGVPRRAEPSDGDVRALHERQVEEKDEARKGLANQLYTYHSFRSIRLWRTVQDGEGRAGKAGGVQEPGGVQGPGGVQEPEATTPISGGTVPAGCGGENVRKRSAFCPMEV